MTEDTPRPVKHPNDQQTSDQSPSAGGLGAGRDLDREERNERERREDREDVIARDERGRDLTPRRYDEKKPTDATMPSNDATLRTEI